MNKVFEVGDIIAIQLQTTRIDYDHASSIPFAHPFTKEEFYALDGKYILIQVVEHYSSWSSKIVPEVKNYWIVFRVFDAIFDEPPTDIDFAALSNAIIQRGWARSSIVCGSSIFYFKRRKYRLLGNRVDILEGLIFPDRESLQLEWQDWDSPDFWLLTGMTKK